MEAFIRKMESVNFFTTYFGGMLSTVGALMIAGGLSFFAYGGYLCSGIVLLYLARHIDNRLVRKRESLERENVHLTAQLCACDARWGKDEVDKAWANSIESKND